MAFGRKREPDPAESGEVSGGVPGRAPGRHTRAAVEGRYDGIGEPEEPHAVPVPEFGPYDIAVVPADEVPRLDLGTVQIPNVPGIGLQLEATPNGQVGKVMLDHDGSRLQLSVHAAPRTEGIWDEIRAELRTDLLGKGAKVVELEGDYGPQLAARQPAQAGGGYLEARYIGIDGPRWFVMAVLVGPAAADPDRAQPFHTVLRDLVVDRGPEARPVKEVVPLRLPPELAAQLAQAAQAQQAARAQQAAAGQTQAQPPTQPPTQAQAPR